jgi:two-component system response regulator FixJ
LPADYRGMICINDQSIAAADIVVRVAEAGLLGFDYESRGRQMSGSRIVAVVDDDIDVLDSLKFLLETAGYAVSAYPSATAFLDDRTRPACLIVDQHMPGMTGLELIARLRRDAAEVPALLITAAPGPPIAARASELGVTVLEKPPAEQDLLAFIDAYV